MNFIGSHVNVTVSKIVPTGLTNQIAMEALDRHQLPLDERRLPGVLRQQDAPPPLGALQQHDGLLRLGGLLRRLQQLPWLHQRLPNQSNVVQNFKSIIFGLKS